MLSQLTSRGLVEAHRRVIRGENLPSMKGHYVGAQPLEARLAHIEGAFVQIVDRLNGIDRRFDTLEQILESRFQLIEQRFNWLSAIVLATWITTILTILFHK